MSLSDVVSAIEPIEAIEYLTQGAAATLSDTLPVAGSTYLSPASSTTYFRHIGCPHSIVDILYKPSTSSFRYENFANTANFGVSAIADII